MSSVLPLVVAVPGGFASQLPLKDSADAGAIVTDPDDAAAPPFTEKEMNPSHVMTTVPSGLVSLMETEAAAAELVTRMTPKRASNKGRACTRANTGGNNFCSIGSSATRLVWLR